MATKLSAVYNAFFASLLKGDKAICSRIIREQLKAGVAIDDIYENILKKSLYQIGELWEMNQISVATEHLSSLIVETILSEMYLLLNPAGSVGKKAVLGCVPGELHQIGIKMTSDIMEKNGWETFFLGSNVPIGDLISFSKGLQPNLIGLSLSLYFNFPVLDQVIRNFRYHFPDTPVIVGGQAFTRVGSKILSDYKNVYYLEDLYDLEQFLQKIS